MSFSLLMTVVLLAFVATPHCVGMCGCSLAKRWLGGSKSCTGAFLLGRIASYALVGFLAGGASEVIRYWVAQQLPLLHALHWVLLVLVGFLGLYLLIAAKPVFQDQAIEASGIGLKQNLVSKKVSPHSSLLTGLFWGGMPCGVLYAAIVLAYLSASAWAGAFLMSVFALLSALSLVAARQFQSWLKQYFKEAWVFRANGIAILFSLSLVFFRQLGWLPTPAVLQNLGFCL